MKTFIACSMLFLFIIIGIHCEEPFGIQRDIAVSPEVELRSTVKMLQEHFHSLDIFADDILSIINTPVIKSTYQGTIVAEGANRAIAMFWNDEHSEFVSAGDVFLDGNRMYIYEDDESGILYHLNSRIHSANNGKFPDIYKEKYPYTWEATGSPHVPDFMFSVISPKNILITNPQNNSEIDTNNDLVIEFTGGESAHAVVVKLTPKNITHTGNQATMQIGKAYTEYFYGLEPAFTIPSDTLKAYSRQGDTEWDNLSLSLESITLTEKELSDGQKIKAVIITGDLLILKIQN